MVRVMIELRRPDRLWYEKTKDKLQYLIDEYLEYYKVNKEEATNMLELLTKLDKIIDKKLK